MDDVQKVLPISSLVGKAVLSLRTGNKLGELRDLIIDPANGLVIGLTIASSDGVDVFLPYEAVFSFGRDAVMADHEPSLSPLDQSDLAKFPRAASLIGTKIITASGRLLGQIRNVLVTTQPPPVVIYSFGESFLDRLLGRELYLPASSGYVFSDDAERLVVPDECGESAVQSIGEAVNPALSVHSFEAGSLRTGIDDTWVVREDDDEFQTVLHSDDDDTVVRLRPDLMRGERPG